MDATPIAYACDLTQLDDEELVALSHDGGYEPATAELVVRYYEWIHRQLAYYSWQCGLSPEDAQDVQQEGHFGLLRAIARYHTAQLDQPDRCPFPQFLRLVLRGKFQQFVRRLRRHEHHLDRTSTADEILDRETSKGMSHPLVQLFRARDDPAWVAERQELLERLEQAVHCLTAQAQRVWELCVAGHSLEMVAEALGISYYAAKRLRHKVLEQLTAWLQEPAE